MTTPTLDEVIAALVPVLGAVSADFIDEPGHRWAYWMSATVTFRAACVEDYPVVLVGPAGGKIERGWVINGPANNPNTVTLDALPERVREAAK